MISIEYPRLLIVGKLITIRTSLPHKSLDKWKLDTTNVNPGWGACRAIPLL